MASEIQFQYTSSGIAVIGVVRNSSGQLWNGDTNVFEDYNVSNLPDYVTIACVEEGTTAFYVGDFPTAITSPGTYSVILYSGSSINVANLIGETEEPIVWNGSQEVVSDGSDNLITESYAKTEGGIPSSASSALTGALIAAASKMITRYTRRQYKAASYAEYHDGRFFTDPAQYFGGSQYSWELLLDRYPIVELTQVTLWPYDSNLTEVIPGSAFIIETAIGRLRLKPNSTHSALFPMGFQSVKVEYQAGYAVVPENIQQACALLATNLYNSRSVNGTMQSEKIGNYQYTRFMGGAFTQEVKDMLATERDIIV